MSLSQDPTFSLLKNDFVCGYRNIDGKHWAGASGKHPVGDQAVDTTNGAGPHNIQMFVLTPDGVVLHCLPGYWHSQDLASELRFAEQINTVWLDSKLTREEKDAKFTQMNLRQIALEPPGMSKRSHLQGFDLSDEAKKRPHGGFFYNPALVDQKSGHTDDKNVKTVDIVMHERISSTPFVPYKKFDVADYVNYGKNEYDKQEQFRMANGQIAPGAKTGSAPMIGNDPRAHPIQTQVKRQGKSAVLSLIRAGISGRL